VGCRWPWWYRIAATKNAACRVQRIHHLELEEPAKYMVRGRRAIAVFSRTEREWPIRSRASPSSLFTGTVQVYSAIRTALIVFRFKGTDATFGNFPSRLKHVLSETLSDIDIECVVFPAYEVGTVVTHRGVLTSMHFRPRVNW
jgi:hypothetical protein